MKKAIMASIVCLFIISNAKSQSLSYLFLYDNSGNRIGVTLPLKSAIAKGDTEEYNTTFESYQIKLYPNPTKGTVSLDIPQFNKENGITYFLMNMSGNLLIKKDVVGEITLIEMGNYPPGMYLLKLVHQGKERLLKIIKE